MKLTGTLTIDGKEQKFDATEISLELETTADRDTARGDFPVGMQVSETISVSNGKLNTSSTVTSADGKTTTTTTTTTGDNTTTTTTKRK